MKKLLPFILIFIVVASCGCTLFSNTPVKVEETTTTDIADVISITKVTTLPQSPLYTDSNFKVYVTLKNNDKEKTVNYVNVEVYDSSVFTPIDLTKGYVGDILPQGEKVVPLEFRTPDSARIANVETDGMIKFRVTYQFQSIATYDIITVNEQEIEKQEQSGNSVHLLSSKIIGSGPLRIYPELVGSTNGYIVSGTTGKVGITLKNEGSGIVRNARVETGMLSIEFPSEYNVSAPGITEYDSGPTANAVATGMVTYSYYTCPSGKKVMYAEDCSIYVDPTCCCSDCSQYQTGDWQYFGYIGGKNGDCTSRCKDSCSAGGTNDVLEFACCGCKASCGGTSDYCPEGTGDCYCKIKPKTGGSTVKTATTTTSTTVPIHIPAPSETIRTYFECPDNKCINSAKPIDIVGKESIPFLFDITSPSDVSIYKTSTIHATVEYFYELRNQVTITVKPAPDSNWNEPAPPTTVK